MNWYKKSQQLTMPWYKPPPITYPNPENLSPELKPFKDEILQNAKIEGFYNLIKMYYPQTEQDLIFLLNASNEDWAKITFPTGAEPIFVVQDGSGHTKFVIEDLDRITDAWSWVSNADPEDYIVITKEENFWDGVSEGYKLYHGTHIDSIPSIMRKGLEPRRETRGLSNKYAPDGVFCSAELGTAQSYYEVVIEIDVGSMKRDKVMPEVSGEEPIEEGKIKEDLANHIGMQEYFDESYSSDGLREDTVIFYGRIPPKYLKVLENKEV